MASNKVQKTKQSLPNLVSNSEQRIAEVLPEGMDPKRVVRLARLAIHRNPDLLKCEPMSVIESILQASQLGLEIASPIGGAHLVPYKSKCQMIPDYRGLIRLAIQEGACKKLVAREVYAIDHFEVQQGSEERIIHIPAIDNEPRADEDIIAFYAVAITLDGHSIHEWAPRGDVDKIRERSRASKNGPWVTDYAAMGKKTLVKRLFKWLGPSPRLASAIEIDNRYESGEASTVIPDMDTEESVSGQMAEATKRKSAEMSERMAEHQKIVGEEVGDDVPEGAEDEQELPFDE